MCSLFDCHGHWRRLPAEFRPRREGNCRLFEAERGPTPCARGIYSRAATDAPKGNPGGPGILQFGANPTSHLRPPRLVSGDRPVIGKSLHTKQQDCDFCTESGYILDSGVCCRKLSHKMGVTSFQSDVGESSVQKQLRHLAEEVPTETLKTRQI